MYLCAYVVQNAASDTTTGEYVCISVGGDAKSSKIKYNERYLFEWYD
jgi:hypothetical protein